MHIKTRNIYLYLLWLGVLILFFFIISCSTTANPTPTLTATVTSTPRSPTVTPELESNEQGEGFLLPSVTPAPTATPGVISEFVSEITEKTGMEQKTILGIDVESWINLAVSIILGLIIFLLLSRVIYFVLGIVVLKTKTRYDDEFIKVIRTQINIIFIVIGIQIGFLRLPFIDVFVKQWINQLSMATYVVVATVILWRLLDILIEWYQDEVEPVRDSHQTDTILILIHRFARVLLVTISLITLLSIYNVNVNALIAALGVGGLALSLAAQDSLSNVISGIMIMIDQPFRVGDRIEIQSLGTWGDVVDIGLRSTRIRTLDNRLVIVPNNRISTDQIVNYTYPDPQYRIQIEIGIGYGQDIEKVRQIIVETVRKVDGVLQDRPVDALYVNMGESSMIFRIRWWIESYLDTRRMFDRVNSALQLALDESGVKMPYITYDINLLNWSGKQDENIQYKGRNQID